MVEMWTEHVAVEDAAMQQLHNVAQMPFVHSHVAVMPDAHWGNGTTVGSVIPTHKAIIPAAVGVDIGCGMMAVQTQLTASDIPDNLHAIRTEIEKRVPHGRTNNGAPGDRGAWGEAPTTVQAQFESLGRGMQQILDKHPKVVKRGSALHRSLNHLGTLGTGNHFIEVCLDEEDRVWVMLHSGSRGIGNAIGSYFIERAKEDMESYFITLPDAQLAYLVEGTDNFRDYVMAVGWAQEYARTNREVMMAAAITGLRTALGCDVQTDAVAVNCHHNYVTKENHFGKNVWLTRKGAVRARKGDLGIIPGSMGARSYIVEGLGNADAFHSCSHGAGRAMSRAEARRRFTLEDHVRDTSGVECRKDADVIDETPQAYKDIDAVMASQEDLVKVRHTLRQIVCVKG